jgi:metal-sulfur cluster biosynthetic enzyme
LSGVKEVHVEVVFDPQWHPGLMSDAAKLQLGFDLDYGDSDRPQLAEKALDSGAGRETFAHTPTTPAASRSALT